MKRSYFHLKMNALKKGLALAILSGAFFAINAEAQVNSYLFSKNNGTFTALTGATTIGVDTVDDQYYVNPGIVNGDTTKTGPGFAIGFNFTYNGMTFDKFGVNTNGWISLGNSTVDLRVSSANSPIGAATGSNIIAGFARNLKGNVGAKVSYQLTGSTPNQVLVVEWNNFKRKANGTITDNLNFQIRLLETSNKVEIIYGTMSNNSANATTAQVGLKGATNADFNSRTSTTSWVNSNPSATANSTMRLTTTIIPPSGLTYIFTPTPPCSGAPTAGTTVSNNNPVCPSTNFSLALNGATVAAGLTYQWQSSPDQVTWTDIPTATTKTLTTNELEKTYFRCQVTCSGNSSYSSVLSEDLKTFDQCYCAPTHQVKCSGRYIDSLKITNTTFNHKGDTCSNKNGNAFTFFKDSLTNLTAKLGRGNTYPLSLYTNDSSEVGVWIDFDQNSSFDSLEYVQVTTVDTLTLPGEKATATLVIPETAVLGKTHMRVRSFRSYLFFGVFPIMNNANAACIPAGDGETEEYVVEITEHTGILSASDSKNLSLFPNPTKDMVKITYNQKQASPITVKIFNVNGQLVFSESKAQSAGYENTINMSEFSNGVYMLQVITNSEVITRKIIKD